MTRWIGRCDEECVDNLKLQAESKNVTIETIIPKPALIQGKRDLAGSCIQHCDNAIRYNVENRDGNNYV